MFPALSFPLLPQFFINPRYDPAYALPTAGDRALRFHSGMEGYQPTPLHSLPSLQLLCHLQRLWIKDESDRLGLPSFKILGASWAIHRALCERFKVPVGRELTLNVLREKLSSVPSFVLTSATDGNHGRAVAHAARLLGVPTRIFMPAGSSPRRVRAIESEGVTVLVGGTYDDAVAEAARAAEKGGLLIQDTAFEGYERIPAWIVEGYATLLREVDEALRVSGEKAPTHVFVQMGVGSLAEAVVRHYRAEGTETRPKIIGVEPEGAACIFESMKKGKVVTLEGEQQSIMAGLNCGTMSFSAFPILERGIDCFVTIADERARVSSHGTE
ncbi:MAG: diaminopropionate ammonia-lyase [Bacteroidota bacterium]